MRDLKDVVKSGLCLGCGVCTAFESVQEMVYDSKLGQNIPKFNENKAPLNSQDTAAFNACPAKGYNIKKTGQELYGSSNHSIELGYFKDLYAVHSNSDKILKNASSGGIMSHLLLYLLENKIVDKVAVTKFTYTKDGPRTLTFITDSITNILDSQGSKYCPVDLSSFLKEASLTKAKIAIIGTPCQIAGIRELQKQGKYNNITICIANFCGGFKSYNNIRKIALRGGVKFDALKYFRFRGGGQPGSLLMEDDFNKTLSIPYPYSGYSGYSKHLRCHLCVDATGELADISCGDAWLDKYLNDKYPWSIVLTRSEMGSRIINEMREKKLISVEHITQAEVIYSQRQNIVSKKVRQKARFFLYKFIGYKTPYFDGGYYNKTTSLWVEVKVFLSHRFKEAIEKHGLFLFVNSIRKMIKR